MWAVSIREHTFLLNKLCTWAALTRDIGSSYVMKKDIDLLTGIYITYIHLNQPIWLIITKDMNYPYCWKTLQNKTEGNKYTMYFKLYYPFYFITIIHNYCVVRGVCFRFYSIHYWRVWLERNNAATAYKTLFFEYNNHLINRQWRNDFHPRGYNNQFNGDLGESLMSVDGF